MATILGIIFMAMESQDTYACAIGFRMDDWDVWKEVEDMMVGL